ncbi:MAG: tetratricopeptide repeat protein [Roseivirga sp.]|nr:tetratricopeptide repeat protein [Roseivirga sp.]
MGLFLVPTLSFGQSIIDSLKNVLPDSEGTEKVDVLNQLTWELKFSETTNAISYGDQSLALSGEIGYKKGQAQANYNLLVLYYLKQESSKSIEFGNHAIELYRQLEDLLGMARSWNIMGLNSLTLGEHEHALDYFKKALEQFEIVNNEENILKIEANIGNVYYRMGNYQPALESYLRIVDYAREKGDQNLLAANLQNAAITYSDFGQFAKALESSFEVLKILRAQNDSSKLANTLQQIASTFNELEMYEESTLSVSEAILIDKRVGRDVHLGASYITLASALKGEGYLDSAFYYNKEALRLYEKAGNKSLGMVLISLGSSHNSRGEVKEAEVFFERALEVGQQRKRETVVALSQFKLGQLYIESGETDKAESFLLAAHEYWARSGRYKQISAVTKELSEFYSDRAQYERAIRYQKMHDMAEDSVFGRQKQNELMRLMVRQNLAQQESSLINLPEKADSENRWLLIGLAMLFILSAWTTVYFVGKNRNKIKKLEEDLDKKGRELAFLSLSAMQKENFIREFTDKLKPLTSEFPGNKELHALMRILKTQEIQEDHWSRFKSAFEQIAPHFFDHLLANYQSLTETDLRFCALIRLAIPTKEIARISGISSASVNKARYRLRKRLEIPSEDNLDRFILSI